jgi:hypothetical protein
MAYFVCTEFTYDKSQPMGFPLKEIKRFVKKAKLKEECEDANHCVIIDYAFDTREEAESELDIFTLLQPMIT